jgi:hypothetical protein
MESFVNTLLRVALEQRKFKPTITPVTVAQNVTNVPNATAMSTDINEPGS